MQFYSYCLSRNVDRSTGGQEKLSLREIRALMPPTEIKSLTAKVLPSVGDRHFLSVSVLNLTSAAGCCDANSVLSEPVEDSKVQ